MPIPISPTPLQTLWGSCLLKLYLILAVSVLPTAASVSLIFSLCPSLLPFYLSLTSSSLPISALTHLRYLALYLSLFFSLSVSFHLPLSLSFSPLPSFSLPASLPVFIPPFLPLPPMFILSCLSLPPTPVFSFSCLSNCAPVCVYADGRGLHVSDRPGSSAWSSASPALSGQPAQRHRQNCL